MDLKKQLNVKTINLLTRAAYEAGQLGHSYIGTEHVLLAMTYSDQHLADEVLYPNSIAYSHVRDEIEKLTGRGTPCRITTDCMTNQLRKLLDKAHDIASDNNDAKADITCILAAICSDKHCTAYQIINTINKTACTKIHNKLTAMGTNNIYYDSSITPDKSKCPNLFKYGRNMTSTAYIAKRDPLIGREKEIEQVLQILARRTKNNPCLVGEAGVGKTAIVEGIARLMLEQTVPDTLKNKCLFELDLTTLISGAKYRGDFEERIKACIDETIEADNIILFIDEVHLLINTGAAEGAIDAANILKPYLARGDVHIIGATTYNEFKKNIEKDAALQRRFQQVDIREPNRDDCIDILKGLKEKYEMYHNVVINNKLMPYITDMSIRYIHDKHLPDKAIDILDEACAHVNIKAAKSGNSDTAILTKNDIDDIIALRSGIAIEKISCDTTNRIANIRRTLSDRIIGHDIVIEKITNAICRAKSGLRDENKPIASFLFAGPTGVGKTETAKALAECMFDSEQNLIRIDMSEYMESHSVSKLIGAPPGYVGYNDTNKNLCDLVRRNPYSVILFDEIEKANPAVMNIFLQILDDGILTDATMQKISFKHCIIIMTSNVGAHELTERNSIGFTESTNADMERTAIKCLRDKFTPEFMNRIDDVIIFNKLTNKDLTQISNNALHKLADRAEKLGITLSYDDTICNMIATTDDCKRYGAREINRQITNNIENKLAQMIVNQEIRSGDHVCVSIKDNIIHIKAVVTI